MHLIWHSKHRKQHWISKDIPKEDAKWLGRMLGQLSEEQIKDAFRAAGYGAETTQGFTDIIRKKIADLNAL